MAGDSDAAPAAATPAAATAAAGAGTADAPSDAADALAAQLKAALERRDRAKMLALVLARGADPNPVVEWAAQMWHTDVLQAIANSPEARARLDLNRRASQADDAASLAVLSRNPTAVKMVLGLGYDVNAHYPHKQDTRLLHMASFKGDDEAMVRCLLQHGANPSLTGHLKRLPQHEAAVQGRLGSLRLLLESRPRLVDAKDFHGYTVLHFVARLGGDDSLVRTLVEEYGADPGLTNTDGHTALDLAKRACETAKYGAKVVTYLAESLICRVWGAIKRPDEAASRSVLAAMVEEGKASQVSRLLEAGVAPNVLLDESGEAAVHVAANRFDADIQ